MRCHRSFAVIPEIEVIAYLNIQVFVPIMMMELFMSDVGLFSSADNIAVVKTVSCDGNGEK